MPTCSQSVCGFYSCYADARTVALVLGKIMEKGLTGNKLKIVAILSMTLDNVISVIRDEILFVCGDKNRTFLADLFKDI